MKKETVIYYAVFGQVDAPRRESRTYKEFVEEFGKDEITSPSGIENREFVEGSTLFSWGYDGHRKEVETFDSAEEAEDALFRSMEVHMNSLDNVPQYFTTRKDREDDIREIFEAEYGEADEWDEDAQSAALRWAIAGKA